MRSGAEGEGSSPDWKGRIVSSEHLSRNEPRLGAERLVRVSLEGGRLNLNVCWNGRDG